MQAEQGSGRFPWIHTPNLDRLAAEGVRFRNAFVVSALCAPSRAVFLTGRYNHLNGVASNFRPLPVQSVTHATLLRAAGYFTGYIGKWHMDGQRERPGFDYHASYVGHARYRDPTFIVQGQDVATKGWIDDLSTDYAIEFLRAQQTNGRPWSLVVGFKAPHGPFQGPERVRHRFTGQQARAVPNLLSPAPYLAKSARKTNSPGERVPVNLDYFRCVSAVDDCVGRLLTALDELGFADNTMVIYTSDNGFYLGEHGLGDKRSAYEESLRVPLLVRYPPAGAAGCGQVRDEMILNLDLAPTLLELAGVAVPPQMQGRSWLPLIEGRTVEWRQSWFYEYFAERQPNSRVPDITAVRTLSEKLILYPGHPEWTELFDLVNDPFETRNLYRDQRHGALLDRLRLEHDRLAQEVGYRIPDYVDRPDWWGKPGGPDGETNVVPELRLEFNFTADIAHRVSDTSGKKNHGSNRGTTVEQDRQGQPARRWNGDAFIEVPKARALNLVRSPWTIETVVKPASSNSMILARGGRSEGFALWLKQARPQFTVVVNSVSTTVGAEKALADWAVLTAVITSDQQAALYIDGRLAARAPLPGFLTTDPRDTMQIGADTGSHVVDPAPPQYAGLIQRVSLWRGARTPQPGR